jgi:hypothetical protein
LLEGLKAIGGSSEIDWDKAISSLDKRVFLMHSVHQKEPQIFHTRWALSYLSGPIAQDQIKVLMEPYKKVSEASVDSVVVKEKNVEKSFNPHTLPKELNQKIYERRDQESYSSYFGVVASTFFSHKRSGEEREVEQVWTSELSEADFKFENQEFTKEDLYKIDPEEKDFSFVEVPAFARTEKVLKPIEKEIKTFIYRNAELSLWECKSLRTFSEFDETEDAFRGRLSHLVREKKDEAIDKLNQKYEKKFDMIEKRIMRAEQKVEKEKEQYSAKKTNTFLNIGTALASVLMGGKAMSATSARRAGSVLRSATSASKEKGDISRAEEQLKDYQADIEELREELEDEVLKIEEEMSADNLELIEHKVGPTKTNIEVKWCGLLWK